MIAATLFAACSTEQAAPTPPTGVRVVDGSFWGGGPHAEFDFKGGTLIAYPDFNKPYAIWIHYDDGTLAHISSQLGFPTNCADMKACKAVMYGPPLETIVSGDGRSWLDSELWAVSKSKANPVGPAFLGMSREKFVLIFQGCKDGTIYSSGDLPSLMSVLEGEKSASAQTPTPSESDDSKSGHDVYVVGNVDGTRMPVCNWRHRIGLDRLLPAPKSTRAKLVPASEKTPRHLEVVTEKSVVIDWFANKTPLDRMTIKLPDGHSISIEPRYGAANCPDFSTCEEQIVRTDNTTMIQQTLDGQPIYKSRLWKVSNPLGGPATYEGCGGGTHFSGRNRSEVEAALAGAEKKSSPQEDMVLDPTAGAFAPADVVARATRFCDWTERARMYQKINDAAKKAAKDSADKSSE